MKGQEKHEDETFAPTPDSSCAGPGCVGAGFLYEVSSVFGAGRWPVSPAAAPLDSNVHSHASAFRLRDEVRAPTHPRLFHHSMLASLKSVLTLVISPFIKFTSVTLFESVSCQNLTNKSVVKNLSICKGLGIYPS